MPPTPISPSTPTQPDSAPRAAAASPPPSLVPELDRYAEGWQALADRAACPTQQYIWSRTAADSFCAGMRFEVVTAGPPDRPGAIAPLFCPLQGPPTFCLPGASQLGEPMDLLAEDDQALDRLCAGLARLDHPIQLERVPADSPTVAALERAFRWPGMVVRRPGNGYPVVELDASWCEPESHLNAGRRSDMRRAFRRAQELGPVRFELTPPTAREIPARLERALAVEAAGWKREEGTAMLVDPQCGRFFRDYAASAARQGIARLNMMYIGETPVAMQLAVEVGNRLWLLKIGYDETFARCSPGNLLLIESLRDSATRGLRSVEFLGRSEPWTKLWTSAERSCLSLMAYPRTVRGLSNLARQGARHAVHQLARRLRRH
jgi:hypothetical protein